MSGPYHIHNSSPCCDDANGHWIVCGIGYIHKLCDAGDGRRGKRIARRLARLANEVHEKALEKCRNELPELPFDPGVRWEIGDKVVRLVLDGKPALEYKHPDPLALLPRLRVLEVRPSHCGDDCREALVDWSHGSGWVDSGMQRTTFTERSLLPQDAATCEAVR